MRWYTMRSATTVTYTADTPSPSLGTSASITGGSAPGGTVRRCTESSTSGSTERSPRGSSSTIGTMTRSTTTRPTSSPSVPRSTAPSTPMSIHPGRTPPSPLPRSGTAAKLDTHGTLSTHGARGVSVPSSPTSARSAAAGSKPCRATCGNGQKRSALLRASGFAGPSRSALVVRVSVHVRHPPTRFGP